MKFLTWPSIPNRFGRAVIASGPLLLVCAALPACREGDAPAKPAAPPAPALPPSGWVDTADREASAADAADTEAAAPASALQPHGPVRPSLSATDVTPWNNLHPDQWACYRMLNGYTQRLTVRDHDENTVELVMELFYQGHPVGLPAPRVENRRELSPLTEAKHRRASISFAEDHIAAAGRAWSCLRATARWVDEDQPYQQDTWLCEQAPLSGLVLQETRLESRLMARVELACFGDRESREPACP
jgi:hypothetical protein